MLTVNTMVEINRDGLWTPGVVIAENPHRLVIAVCGNRAHRAYISRAANWRSLPKVVQGPRRRAVQQAHNVFAGT